MTSNFSEITFKSSGFGSSIVSPSKVLTGVSNTSDREIYRSESGTDTPFSHLEIVCRTTFSMIASASCESPFDFLIDLIFSFNTMDNHLSFSRYHYCIQNNPLLQATHINIGYVSHKLVPIYFFASKSYLSASHHHHKSGGHNYQ